LVESDPVRMSDLDYLQLALDEAIAAGQAGEVPVGAVIVHKDAVLVTAQNRVLRGNDPTAHAEVVALRAAGQALGNHRLNGNQPSPVGSPDAVGFGIAGSRVCRVTESLLSRTPVSQSEARTKARMRSVSVGHCADNSAYVARV